MPHYLFSSGDPAPARHMSPHRSFEVVYDRTKVTGILAGHAKVEMQADGNVCVSVVLKQPGGLPIAVDRYFGHGAESMAQAKAVAAALTHGKRCRAVGYQLALAWGPLNELSLELLACTDIALVDTRGGHQ